MPSTDRRDPLGDQRRQTDVTADNKQDALIPRTPLHDKVTRRLRDMITQGELMPGERVPERELCARLGISRTPLREALKLLASEGLIDLQHHRGATVARLTSEDVDKMFEVMEALEALAGEVACKRITDAGLDEIRALHYQMMAHHARKELSEYFGLNQQIHESIVNAANNPFLASMYRGLGMRMRRARYMANLSRARWDQAVREHEHILEALTARDGERLSRLLRDHLRNKAEVVKSVLLKQG